VRSFASPLEALEYLRQHEVDVLFSDIQMPEITGVTMLKILQKKPLVVLTTAYSEYALEGYELDVVDYLLKPITFERFLKAIEKLSQRLPSAQLPKAAAPLPVTSSEAAKNPFIFVKDGTKLVKIRLTDIRYIEGLKDYVTIHLPDRKVVSLQTMKSLEQQLPPDQFIRIHNSFIVSFEAIESIDREKVQVGKVFLPISDTYRKTFREFIDRHNLH
jgi:DNA-binding LytR/AlgR family response regulator